MLVIFLIGLVLSGRGSLPGRARTEAGQSIEPTAGRRKGGHRAAAPTLGRPGALVRFVTAPAGRGRPGWLPALAPLA